MFCFEANALTGLAASASRLGSAGDSGAHSGASAPVRTLESGAAGSGIRIVFWAVAVGNTTAISVRSTSIVAQYDTRIDALRIEGRENYFPDDTGGTLNQQRTDPKDETVGSGNRKN